MLCDLNQDKETVLKSWILHRVEGREDAVNISDHFTQNKASYSVG